MDNFNESSEFRHLLLKGLPTANEYHIEDPPRFALIGIGDFGESVIDDCISKKLYGIDYYYINSDKLSNIDGVPNYSDIRDGIPYTDNVDVKNISLKDSMSDIRMFLEDKEHVFVAVNIECPNSLVVFDRYVEVAKSLNCFVIALTVIPVVPSNVIEQGLNDISKSLDMVDSVIDIPNYLLLDGSRPDSTFYYGDIPLYANAIACVTQIIHGDSLFVYDKEDLNLFFKKSKYIRLLMPTIRKNNIEIAGDINDSLDEYYLEYGRQKDDLSDSALALLSVPEERSTLEVYSITDRAIDGMLSNIKLSLGMTIRPKEDVLGEVYILLGSKRIDLDHLLQRKGKYEIDKDMYSVVEERRRVDGIQHMKKFSFSEDEAKADLKRVYSHMKEIYSSEDEKVISELNRYSECYRYGVVVDKEWVGSVESY